MEARNDAMIGGDGAAADACFGKSGKKERPKDSDSFLIVTREPPSDDDVGELWSVGGGRYTPALGNTLVITVWLNDAFNAMPTMLRLNDVRLIWISSYDRYGEIRGLITLTIARLMVLRRRKTMNRNVNSTRYLTGGRNREMPKPVGEGVASSWSADAFRTAANTLDWRAATAEGSPDGVMIDDRK